MKKTFITKRSTLNKIVHILKLGTLTANMKFSYSNLCDTRIITFLTLHPHLKIDLPRMNYLLFFWTDLFTTAFQNISVHKEGSFFTFLYLESKSSTALTPWDAKWFPYDNFVLKSSMTIIRQKCMCSTDSEVYILTYSWNYFYFSFPSRKHWITMKDPGKPLSQPFRNLLRKSSGSQLRMRNQVLC